MADEPQLILTGLDAVSSALLELVTQYRSAAVVALNEVAEEVMLDAKSRTPVDKGILRDSGHVEHATDGKLEAELRFGTKYAVAVHEHLSEHSPPSWVKAEASGRGVHFHPEGTGPKFLERAIQAEAPKYEEDIAAKIKSIVGGG